MSEEVAISGSGEEAQEVREYLLRYGFTLSDAQARAMQAVDGPVLLVAVPGAGKTTTLTARIGYMTIVKGIAAPRICSLTFTKAAALEMEKRYAKRFEGVERASGVRFSTINSLAAKLYMDWCRDKGCTPLQIPSEGMLTALVREIITNSDERPSEAEVLDARQRIGFAKNSMACNLPRKRAALDMEDRELLDAYSSRMAERGWMDFDDQLVYAFSILRENGSPARALKERFSHWLVDEAQDMSLLQHAILFELVGARGNVFMVGDEDQSIFGFRAASPSTLLEFPKRHPGARVLKMETNYRSGKRIVAAADMFAKTMSPRVDKHMVAARDVEGKISTVRCKGVDERDDKILDLVAGGDEVAVLFRENDNALPLIDALMRKRKAFSLPNQKTTFFSERTVLDVMAFLKLAADGNDTESFMRIYYKAGCYVTKASAMRAAQMSRRTGKNVFSCLMRQEDASWGTSPEKRFCGYMGGIEGKTPTFAINKLLEDGYGTWLEQKAIPKSKTTLLLRLAQREKTIPGFIARMSELETRARKQTAPRNANCTVTTCHSSKGREFDTVIVADAYDGTFPCSPREACSEEEQRAMEQEERRLFYVAATRAKNKLILMKLDGKDTTYIDELVPPAGAPRRNAEDFGRHASLGDRTRSKAKGKSYAKNSEKVPKPTAAMLLAIDDRINKAVDADGVRWVKCSDCGRVMPEDYFQVYGGETHVNRGFCRECFAKRCEKEEQS